MLRFLILLGLFTLMCFVPNNVYAFSAYDENVCLGSNCEDRERTVTIPTPKPSFEEPPQRICRIEEYVCGQTCWDGSFDGDRSKQGMGYCIDKICTRRICE